VSGRRPRSLIGYDGSDLANAALRSAAELFRGGAAPVVTVWELGLGAVAALNAAWDAARAVPVRRDPELVSEVDKAGEHHAAVVADEGAGLARSLGLDAEPHAIRDEVHVADVIVDLAAERDTAAVVVGSHDISGLGSHLLGSTSRQLLARCGRPVVVVRAEDGR
jgi:nucleotide-binding universal stress UspA family protein